MNEQRLQNLHAELTGKSPRRILEKAFSIFDKIALSFSGAEDVVLIDMAYQITKDIQVFTLDTGRLHPETYRFIEKVRTHYHLNFDVLSPDTQSIESLVRQKGLFSFFEDGHQECCQIRKVEPLRRKLVTLDAWVTGQRRDQSLETRKDLREVEIDQSMLAPKSTLIKFNPLANWSSQQVWDYIDAYEVPFNELHHRGYRSIGCEPCTRPTLPGQHERDGRWWWEETHKKECGLHPKNA